MSCLTDCCCDCNLSKVNNLQALISVAAWANLEMQRILGMIPLGASGLLACGRLGQLSPVISCISHCPNGQNLQPEQRIHLQYSLWHQVVLNSSQLPCTRISIRHMLLLEPALRHKQRYAFADEHPSIRTKKVKIKESPEKVRILPPLNFILSTPSWIETGTHSLVFRRMFEQHFLPLDRKIV